MADREKVIEILESCVANPLHRKGDKFVISFDVRLVNAIIELLKQQEAVEPTFRQGKDGVFVWACGSCGAYMYHIYDGIDKAKEYAKYCRQCGRKVKWDDK